jgi:succinyl-CoA synthetase alpha subunit
METPGSSIKVSRAKRYISLPSLALAIKCPLTLPQATSNAKATIEYGTKIVGGVSPGKGGQTHLGLPVFDTVKQAMAQVKPHVSAVFVPAAFAAKAITEAIEAEVPLVVSVAEHVPIHDMLRVHQILKTSRTRLVGPNCPGIVAPEQCRVGIMPYKQYMRGCVGIVSKSGTLSYEAVGATTKAGLGQSIVVGMGGDLLPGTTLVDGLNLFFDHDETKGIIVIGEIGGEAEIRAAEAIREYRASVPNPKPIIAMVAGRTAPQGRAMGHAGAILSPLDMSATAKAQALADAGAVVVPHPGVMGSKMKELLGM